MTLTAILRDIWNIATSLLNLLAGGAVWGLFFYFLSRRRRAEKGS